MDLQHRFTVPAPLEQTWEAFQDIESVAGCFPGATVTEVDGDAFKGSCKVKLGPIALVYAGTGRFVSKDRSAGTFVVEAKGKDRRGNGTAGATVTAVLSEEEDATAVEVSTDLSITGKPAQFGRGVMQEVSDKLLQQFVACLRERVAASSPPPEPSQEPSQGPPESAAGTPVGEESAGDVAGARKVPSTAYAGASAGGAPGAGPGASAPPPAAAPAPPAPASTPAPSPASSPAPPPAPGPAGEQDALDLGSTLLPVLVRSYGKQAAAGLALFLLGWLLGRRGVTASRDTPPHP